LLEPNQPKADDQLIKRLSWVISSAGRCIDQLQYGWARTLGITQIQYLLLIAVADLDEGSGVTIRSAAKRLQVDPSFVKIQTKILEKRGYIQRAMPTGNAQFDPLSLSEDMAENFKGIAGRLSALNAFIFKGSQVPLELLTSTLEEINGRLATVLTAHNDLPQE
jgi:MarR family transcriptional regulator, organic hydroperoxide resistance regulator